MKQMLRFSLFTSLLSVAACVAGHSSPTSPVPPAHVEPSGSTASRDVRANAGSDDGVALFETLVRMVRRYHLFAPQTEQNLGKRWDDDLPRLRAEFAAAKTPEALTVAAWHFGNSLHDVHCRFHPKDRGDRLRLGFRVGVEKQGTGFQFYVERVSDEGLKKALTPGDLVVRVDGVPASKLLEEYELSSNMNSFDNIALEIAAFLTSRRTSNTLVRPGTTSSWVVQPRGGGATKTFTAQWKKSSPAEDGDFAIDYENKDCVNADPKDYGPYQIAARGYRVCIYTSTAPTYRDYPIVRHVSFRYDEFPHGPLADYDLIQSLLARAKPKGVLLDVQDNGGGMNPNVFLEWWTDKPYTDTSTRMLLDDELLRDETGEAHISSLNDAVRTWYARELQQRAPGQRISSPRPFMCKPNTCDWENRYTPRHRVTLAPVALLLGPGCASSCDALAWHFEKTRIGPLVGRVPMAGFTTHRARFDVVSHQGQPALGRIDFAISYDTPPGRTESIEGTYVHLDVPIARTFENFNRYDALLVDGAIRQLQSR